MAEFTEQDFQAWKPIQEVYQQAKAAFGPASAGQTILTALSTGLLKARAAHHYDETQTLSGPKDHGFAGLIAPSLWEVIRTDGMADTSGLWRTGNIVEVVVVWTGSLSRSVTHKLFGIRIDPKNVLELVPPAASAAPAAAAVPLPQDKVPVMMMGEPNAAPLPQGRHPGGAPRKEFWDDLWLAMFERLWIKNWQPKNQAEIEKAMLDWAAEKGHSLGPTSVKTPARKLFALSKN